MARVQERRRRVVLYRYPQYPEQGGQPPWNDVSEYGVPRVGRINPACRHCGIMPHRPDQCRLEFTGDDVALWTGRVMLVL